MLFKITAMKIGDRAIDFNLKGVDGKNYSLQSLNEYKILVLGFTCNHCPYVRAYEDRLISVQKEYASKGVRLVTINSNDDIQFPEDNYENMIKRAGEKGFNFPYIRDDSQRIARAYGAQVTPEIFVFDEKRLLKYHGRVDDNKDPSAAKVHDLKNAIDALLAGREPPVKETNAFGCTIKWKN